jgi:lysophospholipase L1-like esterase
MNFQKILVVGDSLTKHQPSPDLNWNGDWGMAAGSEAQDYVHLFLGKLSASQGSTPTVLIMAKGGGKTAGQAEFKQEMTEFGADLAIVQLGENDGVSEAEFRTPYREILSAIRAGNSNVTILCLGVWAPPSGDPVKDDIIRQLCREAKATFVDTSPIAQDPQAQAKNSAHFSNPGVNWHPGDIGMAKYADALWTALNNPPDTQSVTTASSNDPAETITDEKWDGHSATSWLPANPSMETQEGIQVATFKTAATGISDVVQTVLIPGEIAGKWLTVKTRIKGIDISPRPQPYNGAKVCFHFHNAEGKDDYPQVISLPDGGFGWKNIEWRLRVPDNVVSGEFGIGLENVRGTLWVGPLTITKTKF